MHTKHFISALAGVTVALAVVIGSGIPANAQDSSARFVAKSPLKLGYSVYDLSNPAFQDWLAGVKAGAEAGGAELVVADQKSSLANQVSGSADLINQGISGLVVTPVQPAALPQTINLAHENQIPVVIGDIGVAGDYDGYVVSDSVEAGRLAAQYIIEQLKDKPGTHEIGMVLLHAGSVVGEDRNKGFREEIAKYPNFKIVAEVDGNDTAEGGFRAAKDELAAHPNIKAIHGTNGGTALGAARALQTTGRKAGPDGVIVIGIDGTQPELDAIAKGELTATIGQNFYGLGKTAAQVTLDLINGKSPKWDDKENKTILYPVQIVDQANLDEFVQFLKDQKK